MNQPTPTAQTAPEGAQITPLPYEQDRAYIVGGGGIVARANCPGLYPRQETAEANAAFIVTACNQHAALTAEVKRLQGVVSKTDESFAARDAHWVSELSALTASNAELRRALEESAHQLDLIARNLRSNEMNGTAAMLESMAIRYRAALGKEAK